MGAPGVIETHSSVVVLLGDRAYKFKKPVDLGFLNYVDAASRRAACEREVAANRRLSPDVYLGVGELALPGDPSEPVVVMRGLPRERKLSVLVRTLVDARDEAAPASSTAPTAGGQARRADDELRAALRAVARQLAMFHRQAGRSQEIARHGTAAALTEQWRVHLRECRAVGAPLSTDAVDRMEAMAVRYWEGRERLAESRIFAGWVCDGHGDLLAEDIFCMDDGPRILDCIDFDDRLRWGDVLLDVAFLAMDLERLGAPDLATAFLRDYRQASGESHPASLEHHYLGYRASVRAKVAAVRAQQQSSGATGEVDQLAAMALDHLDSARVRLVLVGGLPGSGKSTLAQEVGRRRGWLVLSSDLVRKDLAGIARDARSAHPWEQGLYAPEHTHATYCELMDQAAAALSMGSSVVLDASWRDAHFRHLATMLAEKMAAELVEIRCVVAQGEADRRLRARQSEATASDADEQVAATMAKVFAPWPSANAVSTSAPFPAPVEEALAVIDGSAPGS